MELPTNSDQEIEDIAIFAMSVGNMSRSDELHGTKSKDISYKRPSVPPNEYRHWHFVIDKSKTVGVGGPKHLLQSNTICICEDHLRSSKLFL